MPQVLMISWEDGKDLPIRAIIKELGGTVSWDGADSKVTIQLDSKTIELWIGNKTTRINGTSKQTDVAWNGSTRSVTINE